MCVFQPYAEAVDLFRTTLEKKKGQVKKQKNKKNNLKREQSAFRGR